MGRYRFTISGGNVTAIYEYENGAWHLEGPDSDEVWAYDSATGTVTETEWDGGVAERVRTYRDADGDGIYLRVGTRVLNTSERDAALRSNDTDNEPMRFTIVNGVVTQVFEYDDGRWEAEDLDDGETYTVQSDGTVMITDDDGEIEEYRLAADGNYYLTRRLDAQGNVQEERDLDDCDGDGDDDDLLFGSISSDRIRGGLGDDTIEGGAGNDHCIGGGGSDDLIGGAGDDDLDGDSGDDVLAGGSGNDDMNGGSGRDRADYGSATGALVIDLRNGTATGQGTDVLTSIEDVSGGRGADRITGSSAANIIEGGSSTDRLYGMAGNDTLLGGTHDDSLSGGDGDDCLAGGTGRDTMTGGAGRDRFDFNHLSEINRDIIRDFRESHGDLIDLRDIDAIAGGSDNAFVFVGTATATAGRVWLTATAEGALVNINTDQDIGAEYQILLVGVAASSLERDDFLL